MSKAKDLKRKRKIQAKQQATKRQAHNESAAFAKRFNADRKIGRDRIRDSYRERGMTEEEVQRRCPVKQDKAF
jgi:hypothetical protein